ncbi:MAG: glycosyltransferase family 4 protein [Clostridia bacterium]|nr:glycosyltransferase family 4 protein [Clostridia bacterium]
MKIGFLIQKLSSGGAERATCAIANELSQMGEDVEIITFDSGESFYPLNEKVSVYNMELTDISKSASLKRVLGCIKRGAEIRKSISARGLDVLVCMSTNMNLYGVISTAFSKTKVVGTERNNPYKYKADFINATLKKFSALFLDGFVFQTEASSVYYASSVRKKGTVIQNAVFNPLVKEIEPATVRDKTIYGVGRLSAQKRFSDLISAFSLVEKDFPDYTLTIFGEGEDREKLQRQIDSLSLSEKINLAGTDKNALRHVAKGSVFVLSSDYEGMPNVLMEAMAVGTPCVSTRCKMGPEELITDGVNGLLVPVGDVDGIKNAVESILKNPELSQKLSENGREILKTNDVKAITSQWLDYLNSIK